MLPSAGQSCPVKGQSSIHIQFFASLEVFSVALENNSWIIRHHIIAVILVLLDKDLESQPK